MVKARVSVYEIGRHITWCPGCGNFGILSAFKKAVAELVEEGKLRTEQLVVVGGIGCHGKIVDYLEFNSFGALHGRALPLMQGIKLANPELKVVGFVGDGDLLDEGLEHFVHAAKRNADVTVILHDNHNFALTTSQRTATSARGFRGRSTPYGNPEDPLNPDLLALVSGATFVARTFAGDIEHMTLVFKEAMLHRGFALVHVLQPCVTWFNTYPFYRKSVYRLEGNNTSDFEEALKHARRFYIPVSVNEEPAEKIPIGVFYKVEKPVYSDKLEWIRGKVLAKDTSVPSLKEILEALAR